MPIAWAWRCSNFETDGCCLGAKAFSRRHTIKIENLSCDLVHTRVALSQLPMRNRPRHRGLGGSQMAAIAKVLSRASGTEVDVETVKTLVMFCGVGLMVSLLFATYGLDLSPGFF
jgi:hypothetical protein